MQDIHVGEVQFIGVPPKTTEKQAFLKGLQNLCPKAALLNVFFQKEEQDKRSSSVKVSQTIDSFYHPCCSKLSAEMLHQKSRNVFEELKITEKESWYLDKCTCLQSQSLTWFHYRRGHITASHFRAACNTSIEKPAESLVGQILQQTPSQKECFSVMGIKE